MNTKTIRTFMEKYNADMMESIDMFASERGIQLTNPSFKGIDIDQSFQEFTNFLTEYATNLSKNDVSKKMTIEGIKNNFNQATNHSFAEKVDVHYKDMPSIITSYLEHMDDVETNLAEAKSVLLEHCVSPEYIGVLDELWENYNEHLTPLFYEMVDHTIMSSGYYTKQRLFHGAPSNDKKIVFV